MRRELVLVERDLGTFKVRGAVLLPEAGRAGGNASPNAAPAIVWDTLAEPRDMAPVAELLAGRPAVVVYSHADWDHCWGTAGLPNVTRIVAQEAARGRFVNELPAELEQMQAQEPGLWDEVRLAPPDTVFRRTKRLRLGGDAVLELISVPGHTPDSSVGWIPAWGVLLAGDVAEDPAPQIGAGPPDGNNARIVGAWARTLERLAALPGLHTVIPGHGAVSGPELLKGNAAYLRA